MRTPDTPHPILADLAAQAVRVEQAENHLRAEKAVRDAIVCAGRRQGLSTRKLGKAAGVEHQRITQVEQAEHAALGKDR
jgi:hypothetical protein